MTAIEIIEIILPTLMSMIFIDIVTITLMKGDIGMKIRGIKILELEGLPSEAIEELSHVTPGDINFDNPSVLYDITDSIRGFF